MTPILPSRKTRRTYRAPVGLPPGREDWRIGTAVSLLLHLLVIAVLLLPLAVSGDLREIAQGSGGAGPAGGGGGGTRGTGALRTELLRFVRIAPPAPPAPQPKPVALTAPAPVPPEPAKAVTPPVAQPATTGAGAGTGADGSAGTGPGSGVGAGAGVGTGAGSGVGPGTGGGTQANYPPSPIEMIIPPLPVPASIKGFHLIADFDIDEKGRVLSVDFAQTPDRGYNRRLAEVLRGYRFRPGTRPDGTPIRMKFQLVVDLY